MLADVGRVLGILMALAVVLLAFATPLAWLWRWTFSRSRIAALDELDDGDLVITLRNGRAFRADRGHSLFTAEWLIGDPVREMRASDGRTLLRHLSQGNLVFCAIWPGEHDRLAVVSQPSRPAQSRAPDSQTHQAPSSGG